MSRVALRVAIAGCGLIGTKRAGALGAGDELVGCFDISASTAEEFARGHGTRSCASIAA